jgi:hypothetical protein
VSSELSFGPERPTVDNRAMHRGVCRWVFSDLRAAAELLSSLDTLAEEHIFQRSSLETGF